MNKKAVIVIIVIVMLAALFFSALSMNPPLKPGEEQHGYAPITVVTVT